MARARWVRFAGGRRGMLLAVVGLLLISAAVARGEGAPEGLKRLDFLLGAWRGTSSGEPGNGTVERSCAKALHDRFIECRTMTTYPPQEKNKKGEVHVDRAFYSYDKAAKKLRLRQFHGEGFVNSYMETEPLVFVTVEIENIPQGWRARETYEPASPDSWSERFDLARPGKEFAPYTSSKLERVE
jgi:hypothetical protein